MIRVTVWNEFQHERTQEKVKDLSGRDSHLYYKFLRQERSFRFGRLCLTRRSMG